VGRSDACIDGVYFFFLGNSNLKRFRHRRGGLELYKAFSSCHLTEVCGILVLFFGFLFTVKVR
jgi:hypothetical protein